MVEKAYALWLGNVVHLHDGGRVRDPIFLRWPSPGEAWEAFQEPIRQMVEAGSLVMCTNTDSEDHPEYHLTQGHEHHSPFPHGPKPMVLRYLATPAGSIAWRNALDELERKKADAAAARAAEQVRLREAIHALTMINPCTASQIARKLSGRRVDILQALAALAKSGQVKFAGRSFWGQDRWEAVDGPDGSASTTSR